MNPGRWRILAGPWINVECPGWAPWYVFYPAHLSQPQGPWRSSTHGIQGPGAVPPAVWTQWRQMSWRFPHFSFMLCICQRHAPLLHPSELQKVLDVPPAPCLLKRDQHVAWRLITWSQYVEGKLPDWRRNRRCACDRGPGLLEESSAVVSMVLSYPSKPSSVSSSSSPPRGQIHKWVFLQTGSRGQLPLCFLLNSQAGLGVWILLEGSEVSWMWLFSRLALRKTRV